MPVSRSIVTRRTLLVSGTGLAASTGAVFLAPLAAAADRVSSTRSKLVIVLLRGAMDGLSAVFQPDDGKLHDYRSDLVPESGYPLEEGFSLHPALKNIYAFYKERNASVLHAVSGPYRARSHFLAQDLLESGTGDGVAQDGWLNRVLRYAPRPLSAVSVGPVTPRILQGAAASTSWSPPVLPEADTDTIERLVSLYENDALLGPAFNQAIELDAVAGDMKTARKAREPLDMIYLSAAGRLLAAESGPDIAMVGLDNWDTHASQSGRLERRFKALDDGLYALRQALGDLWATSLICVVTEFGRTVRQNGSKGTDHGTGSVAFIMGGMGGASPSNHLTGGHILGDWPGLAAQGLFEERDLYPANDIRSLFKAALAQQFGFEPTTLARDIFPHSATIRPLVSRI